MVTGNPMPRALFHILGPHSLALLGGYRAARMEYATGWRIERRWHLTLQQHMVPLRFDRRIGDRYGRKQRLCVGMKRFGVELPRGRHFDHLAQIHHGYAVAD